MDRPDSFTNVDAVVGADSIRTLPFVDVLYHSDYPISLFTAALLFTHGGFERDPVVEFDARFPAEQYDLKPFHLDLCKDGEFFFRGMGVMPLPGQIKPVCWDKRLYGIDSRRAEECFSFLGGIAYSNPRTNFFAQSFRQSLFVPSPKNAGLGFLSVNVFGFMSNRFTVFMKERINDVPVVTKVATTDEHLLPPEIQIAARLSGFTGEDPLTMRDGK